MTLSDIERRFDIEVNVENNRNCRHCLTVCIAEWNISWGCKNIGIRQFKCVASPQYLCNINVFFWRGNEEVKH